MQSRLVMSFFLLLVITLVLPSTPTRRADGASSAEVATTVAVPVSLPVAAAPAAEDPAAAIVEDSMHEFMEYVFQPTYRRLKASMAAEPADNADWKAIKSDALILAESCNLLFVRQPENDAADWNRHAAASRIDGASLYESARAKDFAKATTAYKAMLEKCNACHRQFENGKHTLIP